MRAVSSLPSVPAERRGVDADRHRQARLVDVDRLEGYGVLGVGERLADGDVLEARHGDDVAGSRALGGDALERFGDEELGDLRVLDRAVDAAPRDALAALERAVDDATERESTEVGRRVEVADERLEAVTLFVLGRGYVVDDRLEERREVAGGRRRDRARPSLRGHSRRGSERRSGARRRRGRERDSPPLRRPRSTRASGRSTLLMTSTTGRRFSRVFRRTNRVWGSGPSAASTRRITASTMASPRSTSPPKSAWPGVSMMLIVRPCHLTAVFLARMVMPFSRSRSPESMTRSVISSWAVNEPVWRSILSTSVVFPWSTWAMMAIFLRDVRSDMAEPR